MGNIKMNEIPALKVMADGKLFKRDEQYCPERKGFGFDNSDKFHVDSTFQ